MDYYICGMGFVIPGLYGCGRDFHSFNPKVCKRLDPLSRKEVLDKPYKPFGRMDFFSKTGFSGIYFACKDADFNQQPEIYADKTLKHEDTGKSRNTSIIASSVYGCIDTDKNFFKTTRLENGKNASPALFAYTLPNTFLGEASIYLGFTGQNFIINESTPTGLTALRMGLDILDSGESDLVICGLCDTYSPGNVENLVSEDKYNYFPGSLFFSISRTRQPFMYGKININPNKSIEFNGKSIDDLKTLAQLCMNAHSDVQNSVNCRR